MEVGEGPFYIDHSVSPSTLGGGGGGAHLHYHSVSPSTLGGGGGGAHLCVSLPWVEVGEGLI